MTETGQGTGPSPKAWARLLERLGPDPERAGLGYEALRQRLVSFFTWRGARDPAECADECLDRLATKLEQGTLVRDVPRFALGIARLVLLEHWRRPGAGAGPAASGELEQLPAPAPPAREVLHDCLEGCLARLPGEGRDLILRYYAGQGRARIDLRRGLAEELAVSESALRNRAQRLRDQLERCIAACLSRLGDTNR